MKTTVGELKRVLAKLEQDDGNPYHEPITDDTPIHIGVDLESEEDGEDDEYDRVFSKDIIEITHQQGNLYIHCEGHIR